MRTLGGKNVFSAFSACLLFIVTIPVVMGYKMSPGEGTSYALFLLYFLLNIGNILYSLFAISGSRPAETVKNVLTWTIVLLVLAGSMGSAIIDRGKIAPGQNYKTHDIILQLEAGLRYLGDGKNPYKETYFGTPMEQWHYGEGDKDTVNPALYHFVMPPWYLLSAYPFYFVSMRIVGYFDGRMPLLTATIGLLIILFYWIRNKDIARLAIICIGLNPASISYLIEGRSDMLVLWWFVLSLFLIEKKHYVLSAISLALAAMTKQTAWFAVPIVLGYLWLGKKLSVKQLVSYSVVGFLVAVLLMAPFLVWDAKAFLDSVIFYLSGNSPNSYPISGYGLGMLLIGLKIISDTHAYYPFIIWQLVIGGTGTIIGILAFRKYNSIGMVCLIHAVTLFLFWYTSRYFNNSHVAYIATLLVIGVFKLWDEEKALPV